MRRGATPPNHELTNRWSWRSIIANLTRSDWLKDGPTPPLRKD
ncbi:hypothetical protein MY3296_007659 [Beauveria thailandica]